MFLNLMYMVWSFKIDHMKSLDSILLILTILFSNNYKSPLYLNLFIWKKEIL